MKTTAKDFALFKQSCEEWMRDLSLGEWRAHYVHDDSEGECKAFCRINCEGRIATIGLTVNWRHAPVTRIDIQQSALHETLHILLADMNRLVNARVSTDGMLETAEHAVIRRLERILMCLIDPSAKAIQEASRMFGPMLKRLAEK